MNMSGLRSHTGELSDLELDGVSAGGCKETPSTTINMGIFGTVTISKSCSSKGIEVETFVWDFG
jgi:hypothetical protein